MIDITYPIPRKVTLAISGGVDSVAVADFLRRNHDVTLLFVDHNTETSRKAKTFALECADNWNLKLLIHKISGIKDNRQSQEEFWRNERYKIFHSVKESVITCHHLDDSVETWLWSSISGKGKLIPSRNQNIIRPFLTTRKSEFISWCTRKNLNWSEDSSNTDTSYTRNYIRHEMMPHVLRVNPGIHKTIRRKILEENNV